MQVPEAVERDAIAYCVRNAVAQASALVARSRLLTDEARTLRHQVELRRRSRLNGCGEEGLRFTFVGVVDGQVVRADWGSDGVTGSDGLLTRADLVVRLGETFEGPDGTPVPASLVDTPAQALMTLLRASDGVRDVTVEIPPLDAGTSDPHPETSWARRFQA